MKKNKKSQIHYPKRHGSAYGTKPGLYLIDGLGHKIRLPLTNFSCEVLTNHLTIGNVEFQMSERSSGALIKTVHEVLNE